MKQPTARRVWIAVNAAESRICGNDAVRSGAMAEGLALAGRRSARLIDPVRDDLPLRDTIEAPWVDHQVRDGRAGGSSAHAFELIASTPQDAVDHCLVAHRLAAKLGRPGLCTIDRRLAESTALIHLPADASMTTLGQVERALPRETTTTAVVESARATCAEVSKETGRTLALTSELELEGASFVLLAAGSGGPIAKGLAAELRRAGIPCGALVPSLFHPFPLELVRERLAGVQAVAVLSTGADGVAELLERTAGAILGQDAHVGVVDASGSDRKQLCEALETNFGLELPKLESERPASNDVVAIGGLPCTPWIEELLLDAIAWLGRLGVPAPSLDVSAEGAPLIVTVGATHRNDRPLNLLVLGRSDALSGVEPLERVRECGVVLLDASTQDPRAAWALFSEDQRAAMVRRRLRLALVAPEARTPSGLQAAILTSTPELARTVGREGTTIDEVCASDMPAETRHALEADSKSLAIVESASLGEPVETDSTAGFALAHLPPATGSEPDSRWRDSLRRFHYENHGVGVGSESHIANRLRPTVLDAPALAADGDAVPHDAKETLFEAWSSTVLEDRRRRQADLEAEIAALSRSLREILGLSEEQGAADGLAATLGRVGADLVDAGVLQQTLSERDRTRDLSPEREQRLAATLEQLERFGKRYARGPVAFVIHPEGPGPRVVRDDVEVLCHTQGPSVAVGLFDGLAHEAVALSRALRTAKLEVGGRFDPVLHGPSLERLDWQSLTPEELLRMPVVAVLETARHLRGPALGAFSELIRAGRPIHVLVEESVADLAAQILEPPFGYQPGLGYLAVAHREALVVRSSLCRPEHLGAGLKRVVTALDPAIVIVAVPSSVPPVSGATQLEAALQARTTPLFVYDPSGGTTWSERFTLEGNPQPERPWPVYSVPYESDQGDEQALNLAFTPAHSAAIDPAWRPHFFVIGPDAWFDDQVEIGEYLRLTDGERSKLLPYLWVVEDGKWTRAIVSWELAFACRDCARAWRILQELGGTDNAYARRAADEARRVAEEEFDRKLEKQQADFAVAMESARSAAAAGAIERLIGLLADPQGLQAAIAASVQASGAAPTPVAQAAVAVDATPIATAPVPSTAVETDLPLGPYIDSFLCTTCNDCIDLNPRMFRYNADKQAEIADPTAGTFKQLVKAAEACPARCIHPGAPRDGDETATPALIERAAKFR